VPVGTSNSVGIVPFCVRGIWIVPVCPAKPWKIATVVAVVPVTMTLPVTIPVTALTVKVAKPEAVEAGTGKICEADNPTLRIWLFMTFTDTLGETVVWPPLSVSDAVRTCAPSATVPVSHWKL